MTKFNYIYFKKDKKLRILNSKLNSKLTVVFLHGLKSDMEGKKPLFLNRYWFLEFAPPQARTMPNSLAPSVPK